MPLPLASRLGVVTALAAALALVSLANCGSSVPDGTRRPLSRDWPNGAVRIEGEEVFHDGSWVKDGSFVFFDDGGEETHRGSYTLGLESGEWTERSEDGTTSRGLYVDGSRHGEWRSFHPNGKLQEKGSYDAGQRVGEWSWYWVDGSQRSVAPYVDGKIHGRVTEWKKDGQVDRERSGLYEDGERVGD